MRFMISTGAAALILAAALPAAAQTEPTKPTSAPAASSSMSGETSTSATTSPSAGAAASDTSATASTSLSVGQSVKDNTGATIGQITDVKSDAAGKKVATIKMGTDTFAVEGASLAVQNGSAVINATQTELRDMLKKTAKPAG